MTILILLKLNNLRRYLRPRVNSRLRLTQRYSNCKHSSPKRKIDSEKNRIVRNKHRKWNFWSMICALFNQRSSFKPSIWNLLIALRGASSSALHYWKTIYLNYKWPTLEESFSWRREDRALIIAWLGLKMSSKIRQFFKTYRLIFLNPNPPNVPRPRIKNKAFSKQKWYKPSPALPRKKSTPSTSRSSPDSCYLTPQPL